MKNMLKEAFGLELGAGLHLFTVKTDCDLSLFVNDLAVDITNECIDGRIIHYDLKSKYTFKDIQRNTNIKKDKYTLIHNSSLDDLYDQVKWIHSEIALNKNSIVPNTVIIVNSIHALKCNCASPVRERCISNVFKKIVPLLEEANITMLLVSDIENTLEEHNPTIFLKNIEQINYMPTLVIYLSNNIFEYEIIEKGRIQITLLKAKDVEVGKIVNIMSN